MSFLELPWQVLIILGAVLTTMGMIINKYQSHKGSALQTQASKYLGSFTTMLFWWLMLKGGLPLNWWIYFLYGGAVSFSLVIYTKAQRISMSQTSLVEPVGQLMGVVLSVMILSEWRLFVGQNGVLLTIALLLMPVLFWLFYDFESITSKKWLKLALVYLTTLAIYKVLVKIFLNSSQAVEVLVFQYLGSLVTAILGVLVKKQHFSLTKKFVLRGWLHGFIGSTGVLMLYLAIKMTTVAQTTLLRTPILITLKTLSGLILFKELRKMTKRKWIGVGVALIIATLVLLTN